MNDASEVLAVIFDCLHKAFVPNSSSDGDSESSTGGSWDCQGQHPCMAHALFGLDVAEQMNCQSCGLESRHLKYTAFFHNINASALRTIKVCCSELREVDSTLPLHEFCDFLEPLCLLSYHCKIVAIFSRCLKFKCGGVFGKALAVPPLSYSWNPYIWMGLCIYCSRTNLFV